MLSKNNYKERLRKMEPKKERFSIRKFSVGAASVLIGFAIFGMQNGETVKADTTNGVQTTGVSGNDDKQAETDKDASVDVNAEKASTETQNGGVQAAAETEVEAPKITAEASAKVEKQVTAKPVEKTSQASQASQASQVSAAKEEVKAETPATKATEVKAPKTETQVSQTSQASQNDEATKQVADAEKTVETPEVKKSEKTPEISNITKGTDKSLSYDEFQQKVTDLENKFNAAKSDEERQAIADDLAGAYKQLDAADKFKASTLITPSSQYAQPVLSADGTVATITESDYLKAYQQFSIAMQNKNVHKIVLATDMNFTQLKGKGRLPILGHFQDTEMGDEGMHTGGTNTGFGGNWKDTQLADGEVSPHGKVARNLVIDGQGHTMNMGKWFIRLDQKNYFNSTDPTEGSWNITLKDLTIKTDKAASGHGPFFFNVNQKYADKSSITFDGVTANVKNSELVDNTGVGVGSINVVFKNKNNVDVTLPGKDYSAIVASNATFADNSELTLNVTNPTVAEDDNGHGVGNNVFYLGTKNVSTGTVDNKTNNGNFTIGKNAKIIFNKDNVTKDKDDNISATKPGIHNLRFMYNVNAQGGNFVAEQGANVELNMGTGRSTAIWAGNMTIAPDAVIDIATLQDNNHGLGVGAGAANTYNGFHYGVVNIGVKDKVVGDIDLSGKNSNDVEINGTLKITRGIPNHDIDTNAPLISFGSASTNEKQKFTLNVNPGGTLDLRDSSSTAFDKTAANPIGWNAALNWIAGEKEGAAKVNRVGLISMWGPGATDNITFNAPKYINLQRRGSQIGSAFRTEGLHNNIIAKDDATKGTPLAQWMGQNQTETPDEAWRIQNLDTQVAGGNFFSNFLPAGAKAGDKGGEYFDGSGYLLSKYWGTPFDKSAGTAVMAPFQGNYKYVNGSYEGDSMAGVHGVGLTQLTNDFTWWSPRRITFGENGKIKINDATNYEPETQAITKTTKDDLSSLTKKDLQAGIKDLKDSENNIVKDKDSLINWDDSSWGLNWSKTDFKDGLKTDESKLTQAQKNIFEALKKIAAVTPATDQKTGKFLKKTSGTGDDFNGRVATIVYKDSTADHPSVDFVLVPINVVDKLQADEYEPSYNPVTAPQGQTTNDLIQWQDNKKAPENTKFETAPTVPSWVTVDPTTGNLTLKPGTDVKNGTYSIPVTVTYPDNSTETKNAIVSVTGKNGDGETNHVYYGEQSTVHFSADAVNTHKTDADKTVPLTAPNHGFNKIVYESGYDHATGKYSSTETFTLQGDKFVSDKGTEIPVSDFTYTWQPEGNGVVAPSTDWNKISSSAVPATTGTTLKDSEAEKTQSGESYPGNSKYRYNFSLNADATGKLGLVKGYNSWVNAFYNFYGATPKDDAKLEIKESKGGVDGVKSETLATLVNHDDLTEKNNSSVKNYAWGTKPTFDANGKLTNTPSVQINFNDGTTLTVPVSDTEKKNITYTKSDTNKYDTKYGNASTQEGKLTTITPSFTDDKNNSVEIGNVPLTPTDGKSAFEITDNALAGKGITIDPTSGVITVSGTTKKGVYNIPVTVTYTDGTTDSPIAHLIVTDKNGDQTVTWGDNGAVVTTVDPSAVKAHETSGKTQLVPAGNAIKSIESYKIGSDGKIATSPTTIDKSKVTASWATPIDTTVTSATAAGKPIKDVQVKIDLGNQADDVLGNASKIVSTDKFNFTAAGAGAKTNVSTPVYVNSKDGTKLSEDQFKALVENNIPLNEIKEFAWATTPVKGQDAIIKITFNDKNGNENTYLNINISAQNLNISDKTPLADKNSPEGGNITRDKGYELTDRDAKDAIVNASDLDKITDPDHPNSVTTYTWKNAPSTDTIGDKNGVVTVTYADGSSDDVDVMVHIIDDAHKYDPQTTTKTIKQGDPVPDPGSVITNKSTDPEDPNHPNLPSGTTYTWTVAPDPSKPGTQPTVVTVHYPDGSDEDVPTTIVVTDPSGKVPTPDPSKDSTKYDPEPKVIVVNEGQNPNPADGISNKDDLPDGTKYTFVNTPDTTTPGDKPVVITVTYPDKSSENVPTIVHVNSDAEKHTPEGQNIVVNKGDTVGTEDAEKVITNKGDLPTGTTYTWESPIDTSTVGDKPGTVIVTYPDGSKDKVPTIVTVKDSTVTPGDKDADKNDPIGTTIVAHIGEDLSKKASDGIANKNDLKNLDRNTPYAWTGNVPSTKKSGLTLHYVTVKYSDGSTDQVPVYVRVIGDSDTYNPVPKVITVEQGDTPNPKDGIDNTGDLPSDTHYKFVNTPDTSTIGDKPVVITVTYPDGTSEDVPTIVHVIGKKDNNNPGGNGGDVTPTPQPTNGPTEPQTSTPASNPTQPTTPAQPSKPSTDNETPAEPSTPAKKHHKKTTKKSNKKNRYSSNVGAHSQNMNGRGNGYNRNVGAHAQNMNGNGANGINGNGANGAGNNANEGAKILPQTGEQQNKAGIFGLALASLAGLFGLAGADKKRKHN